MNEENIEVEENRSQVFFISKSRLRHLKLFNYLKYQ